MCIRDRLTPATIVTDVDDDYEREPDEQPRKNMQSYRHANRRRSYHGLKRVQTLVSIARAIFLSKRGHTQSHECRCSFLATNAAEWLKHETLAWLGFSVPGGRSNEMQSTPSKVVTLTIQFLVEFSELYPAHFCGR